jgi:hypothetical protein
MERDGEEATLLRVGVTPKQMPASRAGALKLIVVGVGCVGFVIAEFILGRAVPRLTALAFIAGPMSIYFGLVGLLMPRRLLKSAVHERFNKAGAVLILLAVIAATGWYVYLFFRPG